jgi:hypothetical protein
MHKFQSCLALALVASAAVGIVFCKTGQAADYADDSEDSGSNSPVVRIAFKTSFQSKDAKVGQKLEALLKEDLKANYALIAPTDSLLIGHVESIQSTRKHFKGRPTMNIVFDRVITPNHHEVEIDGRPIQQLSIFTGSAGARQIVVGAHGELVKVESLETWGIPEFDLNISEASADLKNRSNIRIQAGDELNIRALLPEADKVLSGKLLKH